MLEVRPRGGLSHGNAVFRGCAVFLALTFLLFSAGGTGADRGRRQFEFTIWGNLGTIIDGLVLDDENQGIENARIAGWASSENVVISVDVETDADGYFRIILPDDDYEYFLHINENHHGYNRTHPHRGFESRVLQDHIGSGESRHLRISLQYDPFDLEFINPDTGEPENSGILARGYTSSSYSGRRSVPFLAQRVVPVLDSSGKPVYDTIEERKPTGYTWEERVTKYRIESVSLSPTAGEWVDTGETFVESWFNPKPKLPPGYRWVEVRRGYTLGIWTTTTFKKQYNALEHYRSQGYSVKPDGVERYISGYRTETYREWVPGHYETRTRTVTKYQTETYRSWEQTGTRTETYRVWVRSGYWLLWWWVDTSHWETRTRTIPVYGWVTRTRKVPYTVVEEYQVWVPGRYVTRTRSVPIYSTRVRGYTATRRVPYEVWETKSSSTPPSLCKPGTLTPRDDIRNVKKTYTITTKRVPRTRVDMYTAHRIYEYGGTRYSFLPWEEKRVTVRVVSKNGYSGDAKLEVEAGDGVNTDADSHVLALSSKALTTLHMKPSHASTHQITVKAYDSNNTLVRALTYKLETIEKLPSPSTWERYVGTTERPSDIPDTVIYTSTGTVDVRMPESITVPKVGGGPIYDGGSGPAGPMTRKYTVDYMKPIREDGTLNYVNEETWQHVYKRFRERKRNKTVY